MNVVEHVFPVDHPAAQGHFPGNPIIPGAVLLSSALRAIMTRHDRSMSPAWRGRAKFLHPTRPGDRVSIEFAADPTGAITFACRVGSITVLTGVWTCEAVSASV